MKIYTRLGDTGETSLVGGKRVSKAESQIELYGSVDELNSHLGFLMSLLPEKKELVALRSKLSIIQHQLFNLGSNLACEPEVREKFKLPQIAADLISSLEQDIDKMNESLPELKNFILPGGSQAVAYAHVCRSFSRRVERGFVDYYQHYQDSYLLEAIKLMNRLSDYFFTVARFINFVEKGEEVTWKA